MAKEGSADGLSVIVTGSASGLGAASALLLAKQGARLVVNYSSSQKEAEQTADECRSAGAEVVVVKDVARDEDCKKIVAAAAPWGRLDGLINNAGTTKHVEHANLDGLSAEDFQRIYAVNTIGPFQMVRAARALLEASARPIRSQFCGCEHFIDRRHCGDRIVSGLCREQGCVEYRHAFIIAGACAADPCQRGFVRDTSIRHGSPKGGASNRPRRFARQWWSRRRSSSRRLRKTLPSLSVSSSARHRAA
jgi:NAD(P)-dependent dehydrogenase (short-subunit alcohol dehydrogenase family)